MLLVKSCCIHQSACKSGMGQVHTNRQCKQDAQWRRIELDDIRIPVCCLCHTKPLLKKKVTGRCWGPLTLRHPSDTADSFTSPVIN